MRLHSGRALFVGLVLWGCSTGETTVNGPDGPQGGGDSVAQQGAADPRVASNGTDICAPGAAPDADEAPNAPCALKREFHVPDLTANPKEITVPTKSRGIDVGPTCNGRTGTGYTTCGNGSENCCARAPVPAGIAGTAQVVDGFSLGVYEVTVARFSAFIDAFNGQLRQAGTKVGYEYASQLPASRAEVDQQLGPSCQFRSNISDYGALTWPSKDVTDTVASLITGDDSRAVDIRADATSARLMAKPINCVSYYMAAAFCAWDGGRLPMNSEWAYVALGGSELREYPWGSGHTADKLVTALGTEDAPLMTYPEDFPWFDNGHNAYHIAPPGRKPAGVSKWGHQDMGGNLLEWMADVTGGNAGIVRGGSWEGHDDKNSVAMVNYPLDRTYGSLGFRCAYGPKPPPPPPPPPLEIIPVHRSYNATIGDHLQGLTKGEGAPAYKYEGISFFISKNEVPGFESIPIYRCRNGEYHFLSVDKACEGKANDGKLGYTVKKQVDGTKLVYSCRHPKLNDRAWTLNPKDCSDAGYIVEGTAGYALGAWGGEEALQH